MEFWPLYLMTEHLNTYLYEKNPKSTETRNFQDIMGRKGVPLSNYLPLKIINRKVHYDPDFDSFTYVDEGVKAKYLKKLDKNDYLVFYAGLTPYCDEKQEDALYIIGYLRVEKIIDFKKLNQDQKKKFRKKYSTNSHFKRPEPPDKEMVLVVGNVTGSKLLDKAVSLSKPKLDKRRRAYHAVSPHMERNLGITGSIQRSIPPRFITDTEKLQNLMEILNIP